MNLYTVRARTADQPNKLNPFTKLPIFKLVKVFNTELLSSGLKVNVWPDEWYTNLDFYEK
jgi:hypothetical protein